MIAVDYTLSNRPPLEVNSLHYVDQNDRLYLNQYAQAMISVCEILAPYCGGMKKMICPLFGFGGQLSSTDPVNHCFSLTGFVPLAPMIMLWQRTRTILLYKGFIISSMPIIDPFRRLPSQVLRLFYLNI